VTLTETDVQYKPFHNQLSKPEFSLLMKFWTLDIAFDEDSCKIRKCFADQNMAILRHISLNLLKSEKKHKVGIKIKRQMAGWDNDYLLKVLQIF
jgi:predicted transposase YbfD/YdcC